ncbi:MAG: hypothetical protein B7Y62_11265 [Sphingomonadales bacterium 35-56-22]|uniref:ArnT family glycosyltransferase n=1 Tax=Sphingorhabdus sp. TaxID=1902408 RepID=UPI000BDAA610|nr:glycosyltransferase family 39 protein [Sphingorhabdus sp.]OYY14308.1 MAG: hypothetical protein B7Y62_11265 [Sphingomonadales bacterium 35-56-22]OYZ60042.1 MAG: hypothetical protein B7Y10_08345 [Sphingomonadales bacterium 24-56-14]OZA82320.1 MAG: hypothetical protein B7X66_08700 [Sphingomonadales bacterium 39-57-19]HQS12791.1 glycosyltransferase family 39 protein [Sphingorhabdus sp.]HQS79797.1 glycosyltransferase family 39 protein [Sphingorhabdus sp.]
MKVDNVNPTKSFQLFRTRYSGLRGGLIDRYRTLLIFLIISTGLFLRLYTVNFGLPAIYDPDELMFQLGAVRMLRDGNLNPGWFGHPATTTMYLLALIDVLVFFAGLAAGMFASVAQFGELIYSNPTWVILPGRISMVIFSVGTLFLIYKLARISLNSFSAIAASLLLAWSPLHVSYSQVIRSDMMAVFFMLLTMLCAFRITQDCSRKTLAGAAVWTALAIATKWPFALSGLSVAAAIIWFGRSHGVATRETMFTLAVYGAGTVALLLFISPYLWLEHETVFRNLTGEAQMVHLGANGGNPLENAWWYISEPLQYALGLPALLFAIWGAWLLRHTAFFIAVLLPLMAGFLTIICFQSIIWDRWALPLLPPLAILAGYGFSNFWKYLVSRLSTTHAKIIIAGATILTVITPLLGARDLTASRMNDTRAIASQWARAHVPSGSTVLIEHFALDLVEEPWRFLFPLGTAGCVDAHFFLEQKVDYRKIDQMRGLRSNVDYGTLEPSLRGTCKADFAILTQYRRYRAEKSIFPQEYSAYEALVASGRIVAEFKPEKGQSGGPEVTIVSFRK